MSSSVPNAKQRHYEQKSHGYHASSMRAQRVVDMVGGPGLRVLDVACGPGHLGSILRERGNTVVGAEISETAAQEARKVLNEVHVFDIEGEWPEAVLAQRFDAIVLGEVLEHLFDPVAILRQAARALLPGGQIIITTPNFLVWIARLQVLFGRFRYQRYGLFDFGHIRWFTYAYLKEVVADAGFVIEDERHVAHPKRLQALGRRWPSLLALNFIVSARLSPAAAAPPSL